MLRLMLAAFTAMLAVSIAWAGDATSSDAAPAGPALADLVKTIDAHSAAVNAVAFSADAKALLTGGKDGKLKVWDVETLELLMEAAACQSAINDIAVDPNNIFIASAGEDGFVKVWDAVTLDLIVALPSHLGDSADNSGSVGRYSETVRSARGTAARYAVERVPSVLSASCLAITPDGELLFTGGDDGWVRCYDATQDFTLVYEVFAGEIGNAGSNAVTDMAISSDGATLYVGSVDGKVNLYAAQSGEFESQVLAFEQGGVSCLGLSSNEACLMTGGTNGEVRVWDAFTGSLVKTIRAHAGSVTGMACTEDDAYMLTAGDDGKIKLWNRDAEEAGEAQAHVLGIRNFAMDEGTLATGGADFKVRVWKANF